MTSQLHRFGCLFLSCQLQKNGAAMTWLRKFVRRIAFILGTIHILCNHWTEWVGPENGQVCLLVSVHK